ncbi:hypothetical protein [Streptomyces sp. NPDC005485]|uniref:hypothetical protein n=1 Tax=Streptomyces sp. NPDC005485 TaxID=3155591 RepID=UPI0033B2AF0C
MGMKREPLAGDGLVLEVSDRPGPPPLRFEAARGGRLLLRQGGRPVLLGRMRGESCCRDLFLHRLGGFRSPLPPLRSAAMRSPVDWLHRYTRLLEDAEEGPLDEGRWHLARRTVFEPGIWTEDLVRDWPGARLELLCGGGWHGIVPLRPFSAPDAPRVKAYRKHARDGTLAPVLLWWVSFLDGWLILDGHDRAVAALAEGGNPACVVLARAMPDEKWRRLAEQMTSGHEQHMARLAALPDTPGIARQRTALERGFGDAVAEVSYDHDATRTWPLPGAPVTWDALAAEVMFECRSD